MGFLFVSQKLSAGLQKLRLIIYEATVLWVSKTRSFDSFRLFRDTIRLKLSAYARLIRSLHDIET